MIFYPDGLEGGDIYSVGRPLIDISLNPASTNQNAFPFILSESRLCIALRYIMNKNLSMIGLHILKYMTGTKQYCIGV